MSQLETAKDNYNKVRDRISELWVQYESMENQIIKNSSAIGRLQRVPNKKPPGRLDNNPAELEIWHNKHQIEMENATDKIAQIEDENASLVVQRLKAENGIKEVYPLAISTWFDLTYAVVEKSKKLIKEEVAEVKSRYDGEIAHIEAQMEAQSLGKILQKRIDELKKEKKTSIKVAEYGFYDFYNLLELEMSAICDITISTKNDAAYQNITKAFTKALKKKSFNDIYDKTTAAIKGSGIVPCSLVTSDKRSGRKAVIEQKKKSTDVRRLVKKPYEFIYNSFVRGVINLGMSNSLHNQQTNGWPATHSDAIEYNITKVKINEHFKGVYERMIGEAGYSKIVKPVVKTFTDKKGKGIKNCNGKFVSLIDHFPGEKQYVEPTSLRAAQQQMAGCIPCLIGVTSTDEAISNCAGQCNLPMKEVMKPYIDICTVGSKSATSGGPPPAPMAPPPAPMAPPAPPPAP